MIFDLKNGRLLFFTVAFWGLFATLWMAGVWDLYNESSDLLAEALNVEPVVITLAIVVGISMLFLFAGRQMMVKNGKKATVKKQKKRRKR